MVHEISNQASASKAEQFAAEAFITDRINVGQTVTDEEFIKLVDDGMITPAKAITLRTKQAKMQQDNLEMAEMQIAFTLGIGESLNINNAKKQEAFDRFISGFPPDTILNNAINFGKENGMIFTPIKNKLEAATPNSALDFQEVFTNIYLPLANEGFDVLDTYIPSKEQKAIFRAYDVALRAGVPADEAVIMVRDIDFEKAPTLKTSMGGDIVDQVFQSSKDPATGLASPDTGFFGEIYCIIQDRVWRET